MIGDVIIESITPAHLRVVDPPATDIAIEPVDCDCPEIAEGQLQPLPQKPPHQPVILTPEQEEFYYNDPSPFTLPNVGSSISMDQIRTEVAASGQVSLNDAEFRALIAKSSGEQQSLYDYYGKSAEDIYSQNALADGSANKGYDCRMSESFGSDSSRYLYASIRAASNGNTSCSNHNMIAWTPPPQGTVVKLDYQLTFSMANNSYTIHHWSLGTTSSSTGTFNNACASSISSSYKHYSKVWLVNGDRGRFSTDWFAHIDGTSQRQPGSFGGFTSKTVAFSTYFAWDVAAPNWLSFENGVSTGLNTGSSSMRIDYKMTEM